MIWVYRILLILDSIVLLVCLWLALSMLMTGFSAYPEVKAIFIAWPLLQLPGIYLATRAKRLGEVGKAALLLAVQLIFLGGVTIAWFALVALPYP